MSAEPLPEDLRLLADPSQEVLIDGRPAFSQLASVPLRHLGAESIVAAEPDPPKTAAQPYVPKAKDQQD
ncbi:MAG: hypothetical protein QOI26_2423 [Pseudonocardiales bacterium]|jgi:hypothetical protein|nr:hypothetical protein [Pseudonocardiales bacterium]